MIKILKDFLYRKGYKINKISKNSLLNDNPFLGVQSKIGSSPIIFDVGANQGQTILKIKSLFPDSNLHSFEPSKICFKELSQKFENNEKLILNNLAVGAERGVLEFNEYSWSALNSFLKRAYSKSGIIDTYFVDIIAVDDYCRENNIPYINLLKTDTEGFELNVLKGASKMMSKNKVQFVFVEVFFYENYIGQSSFGDIYNLLLEKGFNLIRFYDFEYTNDGYASRTDALFTNEKFEK
ncbi:FkbM family methyltransferase [Flavobacterium yafengii]|uniref:FkbM family methyltransferase n=1 Tax=Flavobacterium yafengii TaxID=3041253 RepID=UPI0024A830B9|nr:FkbM family methyltransferase [Flavobacterium yafengii]MDI6046607.1 FkbM family methyltransferase [Flavobacterium yafengii]